MKNIDYNKLKRYDIGKLPQSTGYLPGMLVNTSGFSSTPLYNTSGDLRAAVSDAWHSTLSNVGSIGSNIYNIALNYTTKAAAAANAASTNIANATKAGLVGGDTGIKATASNAAKALEGEGLSVASGNAGLNTAGKAAAGIGALTSAAGLVNDIMSFKNDRFDSSDIQQMTGTSTQSKYGVNYNTYNGFDQQGLRNITNTKNTQGTIDSTLNGASLGFSIGSFLPGAGLLIGTIVGGIGGLVGGLLGSHDRKRDLERLMANSLNLLSGANTQAESEAASLGLRNQFYLNRGIQADGGKDMQGYNCGKNMKKCNCGKNMGCHDNGKPLYGDVSMVWTPRGVVPGIVQGLAGKGEVEYNPFEGSASVITRGRERVDNIPTGTPLGAYSGGKQAIQPNGYWNNTVILGNNKNPLTGNRISEDARPWGRVLEQDNEQETDMLRKRTSEINKLNARRKLNELSSIQQATRPLQMGLYDEGKISWASILPSHLTQAGLLFGTNKHYTPRYYNPYVGNNNESTLNKLASLRYDPTQAVQNIKNAAAQSRYSITHSPLSAGQMLKMLLGSNYNAWNTINNTIADYTGKNIELLSDALKTDILNNQNQYARMQAGNQYMYDAQAKANAIDDNFRQMFVKNMSDQLGSTYKDWFSVNQFNQAADYQNRLLNYYGNQQDTDRKKMFFDIYNNNPQLAAKFFGNTFTRPTNNWKGLDLDKLLNPIQNI